MISGLGALLYLAAACGVGGVSMLASPNILLEHRLCCVTLNSFKFSPTPNALLLFLLPDERRGVSWR
jgi:hypothetical protein